MKSSITEGSINTLNFIFDVSPAWKRTAETGQRQVSAVAKCNGHRDKHIDPKGMDTT
ncbi:hypothetical protein AB4J97_14345 [Serratia fonticola]|jgi:hypothetical protein|uniref:hypothetical protein n=1 Tax=Serratia fonticola TaxID=47917 RepID=UPI002178BE55|nr:Uncharacterised protein [Serratia fonticola]CAI1243610.1 Uncharacterised protein [Serratia fonticola]CAI1955756.1 Uncharacterised protein [Serratia fonticola]CAI1957597.1 Uncharacterised protein [Serratia fonticola]CAI1998644.1 Uncharacterised protein [Serratia fonticola]